MKKRIIKLEYNDFKKLGTEIDVLISIVFKIIENNPKVIDIGIKLLARLFNKIDNNNDKDVINRESFSFIFAMSDQSYSIDESKFKIINVVLKKYHSNLSIHI